MDQLGDEIYQLPVSGHYDCGYGYGAGRDMAPTPPPKHPMRQYQPSMSTPWPHSPQLSSPSLTLRLDSPRPVSPPTVLPNSFIAARHEPEAESDLSSLSSISGQASMISTGVITTQATSPATSRSSSTREISKSQIQPDPLPSHSNPQQLGPMQSAAYAGPRPIQPLRLSRRKLVDAYSGESIYEISDETKHKLSGRSIHQIYDSATAKSIGSIGYSGDSDEVAAILRGQDIFLRRESPTSNRWLFKPSVMGPALTKKGASWFWMRDKTRGGIALTDAKKNGTVIARIQRDVLSFDRPGLGLETVTEISLAAMALAELARRHRQPQQVGDLAASIAQVALGETPNGLDEDEVKDKAAKIKRRFTLTLR